LLDERDAQENVAQQDLRGMAHRGSLTMGAPRRGYVHAGAG
jgi:hypothetical protein